MKRTACFLFLLASSVSAQGPKEFYVTAAGISDVPPYRSDSILDVTPEGPDVRIRYIVIAPWGKYRKSGSLLESVSFGIVANCGGNEVALRFPYRAQIDLKQLNEHAPEIGRLLELWNDVKMNAFGASQDIRGISEQTDLEVQQAGAAIVPELMSGRFDKGFSDGRMAAALADYRGPVRAPDFAAQLMNADTDQVASYVAPEYPLAAKATGAKGRVLLQLRVDPESGAVTDAIALNGHVLLKPPAVAAARKWRFVPGTTAAQPIHALLDFAWRCP